MTYLSTFWSFIDEGTRLRLRNAITGSEIACPADTLEMLEEIRRTGQVPVGADGEVVGSLLSAGILFPDRAAADEWFRALEAGSKRAMPLVDQIELTNRCPYSCRMCPRTISMSRDLGDMSLDLFAGIVEQIAPLQSYVGLHHFGESLLHRSLADAVRIAGTAGLRTGLSCNPPSLKPQIAARLLEAGISSILLSLDSLDAETYRAIRGPAADLDKALGNLAELVRQRDAMGCETTITVQLIQMAGNAGEAERFLAYCREVGVDRGVVVRLGRWDFDDDRVAELGTSDSPLHTDYCRRPWESVVVLWDGRVVPCCHDYDGIEVLGDLRKQTLAEIWKGPKAVDFRRRAHNSPLCQACAFSRPFREARCAETPLDVFHRRMATPRMLQFVNPQRRDALFDFDGFDLAEVDS